VKTKGADAKIVLAAGNAKGRLVLVLRGPPRRGAGLGEWWEGRGGGGDGGSDG
jgi:hypothetical protein